MKALKVLVLVSVIVLWVRLAGFHIEQLFQPFSLVGIPLIACAIAWLRSSSKLPRLISQDYVIAGGSLLLLEVIHSLTLIDRGADVVMFSFAATLVTPFYTVLYALASRTAPAKASVKALKRAA